MAHRSWDRIRRSLHDRGLAGSARLVLAEATEAVRGGRGHRRRAGDPQWYEPVRVHVVRWVLAHVPAEGRAGAFVDVGCGRGRVLRLAARDGFARVVGVEIDPALAAEASEVARAHPGVEVVVADSTTWEVPDDATVVFVFNPWPDRASLDALLDAMERSCARVARPVLFAYANPVHRVAVSERGWTQEASSPDVSLFRVPAAAVPPPA